MNNDGSPNSRGGVSKQIVDLKELRDETEEDGHGILSTIDPSRGC